MVCSRRLTCSVQHPPCPGTATDLYQKGRISTKSKEENQIKGRTLGRMLLSVVCQNLPLSSFHLRGRTCIYTQDSPACRLTAATAGEPPTPVVSGDSRSSARSALYCPLLSSSLPPLSHSHHTQHRDCRPIAFACVHRLAVTLTSTSLPLMITLWRPTIHAVSKHGGRPKG